MGRRFSFEGIDNKELPDVGELDGCMAHVVTWLGMGDRRVRVCPLVEAVREWKHGGNLVTWIHIDSSRVGFSPQAFMEM